MKSNLHFLSPAVREVLTANNLEPVQILRYGPRFVCVRVRRGAEEGMFKMVLPLDERGQYAPPGYKFNEYDDPDRLEARLLKEALFLRFFTEHLDQTVFEPRILDLSEVSPVWSLRSYITERTMAAWDSNFVFSPRFFKAITPREAVDFFRQLHDLSDKLPDNLPPLISEYRSTLDNLERFERVGQLVGRTTAFAGEQERITRSLERARPEYLDYRPVITHYEPYPPHIFKHNGAIGLIDWENVGWGHPLQDLSVLYMRCLARPEWQQEYLEIVREYGYFEGHGQLYWDSEMLIQGLYNLEYFSVGGPIGTPEYDRLAIAFFEKTVREVLTSSPYFAA